jgi:hypothetical protein
MPLSFLSFLSPKMWAGVGAALLLLAVAVQTARLHHAKHDLAATRAALVDPVTHRKWQLEAEDRGGDLATCRTNTDTLTSAITTERARLAALQAAGDRALRQTQADLAEAARGRQSAEARAAKLLKTPPAGVDACARSEAAFSAAKEALR